MGDKILIISRSKILPKSSLGIDKSQAFQADLSIRPDFRSADYQQIENVRRLQ
ncbi:hypothetical protein QUF80_13345 [Desulfococcaceae bacterium HSG8]|nr:hypothetical protein [Desulfococcaceae bacterium HSG8]